MSEKQGLGYDGARGVSSANQELIANTKGWTYYSLYEFSFLNSQACTIKINGSNPIPLDAEQGIQIDANDAPISSFIIVESGIDYKWFGKY